MDELRFGEEFFIQEIKEGARLNGETLKEEEEKILKTDVFTVTQGGKFKSEAMRELNDKCIRALNKSYSLAIANNNAKAKSAVVSVSTPGVFDTGIPLFVDASTLMLLYPTA